MRSEESSESKLFGNSAVEVSCEITEVDMKKDDKKLTKVTAITVYSKNNLIVDVSIEYLSSKGKQRCGPHTQHDGLVSSTFLLSSGNRITEVAGVFNKTGLSYIYFKTSMRLFAYGELSGKDGRSFSIPVPSSMRFFGLRGEIGRSEADAPVAIQKLGVIFSEPLYLEHVQADGKEGEEKSREGGGRRRMRRMQTRANKSGSGEEGETEASAAGSEGEEEEKKKRSTVFNKRLRWKNPMGSACEGLYTGDEEKGKGVFLWTNGDKYVGQVDRSVAHGWGVLSSRRSGDTYNGAFVGGEMHGWGELRFGNGSVYEGSFHKGLADGHGTMTGAGGERYVGGFRNGKAHGGGVKKWGEMRKYDGEWRGGKEHGKGKMMWADGSWYDGEWKEGKMDGQGAMVNSHGLKYVGGWKEHKLHGEGKWTFVDGIEVAGIWQEGKVAQLGEFVYLERVKRANKAFMNVQRMGNRLRIKEMEEGEKEREMETWGGEKLEVMEAYSKKEGTRSTISAERKSSSLLLQEERQVSFASQESARGPRKSSSSAQGKEFAPSLVQGRDLLLQEETLMAGGGEGGRSRDTAGYAKLLEGMPDAMLFEVGFTSSNILTAALKNALQGSEEEMEEAQKVLRAGLINLDARSKTMRERRMRIDLKSKDNEMQHVGKSKIASDISQILRSQHESMGIAKLRLERKTTKSNIKAKDASASERDEIDRFDVLQFSDLLDLQAPVLAAPLRGRRVVKEPVRVEKEMTEKKAKRLKTAGDVDAMLRPVVEKLKASYVVEDTNGLDQERKNLDLMKKMGMDVVDFEKMQNFEEDKLTNDIQVIANFLKQPAGAVGKRRSEREEEVQDGAVDEERLLDMRRELLERRLRELAAAEEEERRRRRQREEELKAMKRETMIQHAEASAQKQEEERLLQEALNLVAEEERRTKRIEEDRRKQREEEAEGMIEMERMRRAVLAQQEAARNFSERRRQLIVQEKAPLGEKRRGNTRVAKDGGEEDEEDESTSVAMILGSLARMLGSDMKKFQWTFRFPHQLQTRGGEEESSYEGHPQLLDRSFVALALQSCSFVPSAPVVKFIMDLVDLHVAKKINVFDVQRALLLLDYDMSHEVACTKLQAQVRRRKAEETRTRLEQERAEEERIRKESEEVARKAQIEQEERVAEAARREQLEREEKAMEEARREELLEREREAAVRKEQLEEERRREETARKAMLDRQEREREVARREQLEREKKEAAARREELEREREAAKAEQLEQEKRREEAARQAKIEQERREQEKEKEKEAVGMELSLRSKLEYQEAVQYAEEKSAVKIQAKVRGMQTRKRLDDRKKSRAGGQEEVKEEEQEGSKIEEDLERTREVEEEELGGSLAEGEEGELARLLAEEERTREVEESYVKERAATRIQSIERGRQVRAKRRSLRGRSSGGEELSTRTVMQEGYGGGGAREDEEDDSALKEESFDRSLLIEEAEGQGEREEKDVKKQEHNSEYSSRDSGSSIGGGGGGRSRKESPAKKRSLLKPLPPVSAPHEIATVAEEKMKSALGEDMDSWAVSMKNIQLGAKLDQGNFAVVFQGKLRRSKEEAREEVAVKRLTNQDLTSSELSQFCEEARLMRRGSHPCICSLLAVCVEAGNFALIMELVGGGNLHKVLRRSALPWRTRMQMAIDLSDAVAFLHSLRPVVLHLDIKSPNLLVSEAMRLKLGDFGLAREKEAEEGEEEKSSFQPGTVHWMAPELMTRGFRHEATDIFALGVVLWELWTQKTPYHGKKVREIANAVISGSRLQVPDLVDPPARRNGEYEQLMSACWQHEYQRRPSAAEVKRALGEILELLV